MNSTRGVLYIHSAPSAICPHIQWAVGGAFGAQMDLDWTPQPAERGAYRCELSWQGPIGTSAKLASALRGWQRVRFEVTEEPTTTSEGVRYSYTPELGVFQAIIGINGDILVPEERIKAAIVAEALGGKSIQDSLNALLGLPWDDELEPFRYAGDDAPVRWLHQVS